MSAASLFLVEEGHTPAVCPACGEWVTREYFLLTTHPINRSGKCAMQSRWERDSKARADYLERKSRGLSHFYTGY